MPSSRVTWTGFGRAGGRLAAHRVGRGERAGQAVVQGGGLHVVAERLAERGLGVGQRHPVLRALRAGQRRDDRAQVQGQLLGVPGGPARLVPQALLLGVRLDQRDPVRRAAGEPQVGQRLRVDREDRAGGAELGAHVADRGPVGDRHRGHPVAVELDELADHAVAAQLLGDGEHQVGGGRAVGQFAGEPEPDHLGNEHADRLAEHGRFGLDAADAPAEHAEAVLHGGVRVGADAGVRVGGAVVGHHDPGQVLDVDLVHDAGARRHDLELAERLLAPAQEREPLVVALELQVDVAVEGVRAAEHVCHHRVVDDQFGRDQRVDLGRVAAQVAHSFAHGGQVDDGGDAGQVLEDDPGRGELDLGRGLGAGIPLRESGDVVRGDLPPVLVAQQVLQQDLEAERKAVRPLDRVQPVDRVIGLPGPQRGPAPEAVRRHGVARLLRLRCSSRGVTCILPQSSVRR